MITKFAANEQRLNSLAQKNNKPCKNEPLRQGCAAWNPPVIRHANHFLKKGFVDFLLDK
jgi:hypothetical protein